MLRTVSGYPPVGDIRRAGTPGSSPLPAPQKQKRPNPEKNKKGLYIIVITLYNADEIEKEVSDMDVKNVTELTDKAILKKAQRTRNMTQMELAEALGMKQNSLSGSMCRSRMSLGVFAKILDALDYDVVIADRETGNVMWKLEVDKPNPDLDDDI